MILTAFKEVRPNYQESIREKVKSTPPQTYIDNRDKFKNREYCGWEEKFYIMQHDMVQKICEKLLLFESLIGGETFEKPLTFKKAKE